MNLKNEPWFIHAGLYLVIAVLIFILIQVAIVQPTEVIETEKFYQSESRLRMKNLKEAEILWFKKYNKYTGNIDSLVNFIKRDKFVQKVIAGQDSITGRKTNPFVPLSHGEFTPDSLFKTPKSQLTYIVQVDTTVQKDTVVNQSGQVKRVEENKTIGNRYYIEDPDGYGTVGSLDNDALKNTASWE